MGAFEDFVNRELPRRMALITVSIAGYDGNPNNAGAPAILKSSPLGTQYYEETADRWWRKRGAGATDWEEFDIVEQIKLVTEEDLTFPVDYNDAGAVDPSSSDIFSTQQDIDDFLTAQGATNFKHLRAAWEALPTFVNHTITFNLAAGVHRPDPSGNPSVDEAFLLTNKITLPDCKIRIIGSTNWTELVAAQTVTGFQAGGGDPYLDFAGTPFAGLDLRGKFAVLSTGQIVVIHANTDSRLSVVEGLLPAPVIGSTTVTVEEPSTILRNSLDDIAKWSTYGCVSVVGQSHNDFIPAGDELFQNLRLDAWGAFWAMLPWIPNAWAVYVHSDIEAQRLMGAGRNTGFFQAISVIGRSTSFSLWGCSQHTSSAHPSTQSFGYNFASTVSCVACYFGPCTSTFLTTGSGAATYLQEAVVIDEVGSNSNPSMWIENDGKLSADFLGYYAIPGHVGNVIRNKAGAAMPGVLFDSNTRVYRSDIQQLRFENMPGDCVELKTNVQFDLSLSDDGYQDGGGNAGLGIKLEGDESFLILNNATDVAGSGGDVQMQDGSPISYADILVNGPYVDGSGNRIRRLP